MDQGGTGTIRRGKGVEAAAVTGLARHTIRSRPLSHPSPRAVVVVRVPLPSERSA